MRFLLLATGKEDDMIRLLAIAVEARPRYAEEAGLSNMRRELRVNSEARIVG